ncbi:AraC family transcriptional regulator [Paenibacillus koleovorans]|uniref:AraC family transcriptional regulator n=1 Tax=Paenibacillus koleovorans TaxID=121608 RepID=UPI0013E290CE|nr:AraC family transcriptional regulator [Paenibacillus koleovorans]
MRTLPTSSFFKNLVLLSCIIGILPIVLLGYYSYQKSSAIVQEEVKSSQLLILKQNKEKVESLLKTIDTLTTQAISRPVTTNAVSMQTALDLPLIFENQVVFEKLIYELVQIQVFELGIQNVHMMSYRQNWVFEGGAIYPMQNRAIIETHDKNLYTLQSMLLSYRDDTRRSYWKLTQDEKNGYVLKLIKHIPLNAIDPVGLITVNIPMQELGKRLTGDAGGQGNTLILDDTGAVLASLNGGEIGRRVQDEAYYRTIRASSEPEGFFFYEQNRQKVVVHYNHALYNNWMYVSITPLADLMRKSDSIKLYTILFAAILIALVITTSFIVSHRLYLPINRIYHSIQPNRLKKRDNELETISEHLVHLSQSSTKLRGQIELLHHQTREFFVFKLLQGEVPPDTIDDQLAQHDFPTQWDQWCVLAIQIDTLEGTRYRDKDMNLMRFAIHNIVEELVPPSMRLSPVIQHQGLILILGGGLEEDMPFKVQVFNKTEEIRTNVKTYLNLKISIGISRSYSSFLYAPLAHQESLDALAYRVRLGSESILFIDEVEPVSEPTFRYPRELEFQILEAIKQANPEQARERLHALLAYLFEHPLNHHDYQHFIGRLFNNMTGLVQDAGASVQEVFEKEMFSSDILVRMHTTEQIEDWLWKLVVEPLLTWTEERQRQQQVNISMLIISEIERHYDQELSIDMFAARLHYHPSYISRVFKKDTGVNFSDYLSNYRIEIAKRWLAETDMRISDIAERLQYSTASNFNRNFKKMVQVTPSQYREQFK